MKKTNKKSIVEAAEQLIKIRMKLKEMKKIEDELKAELTGALAEDVELMAGGILLKSVACERVSLNKKALEEFLGPKIKEFETVTGYNRLDVKKVS